MRTKQTGLLVAVILSTALTVGCSRVHTDPQSTHVTTSSGEVQEDLKPTKNVVFFLGNGMGITTLTAARIYAVGEEGALTLDTLPETGFVHTYSNNAQVTDSAAAMSAYMTGVKVNNAVLSMSADTQSFNPSGADYSAGFESTCPATGNGQAIPTLLELMQASGYATGVITTTRLTDATPAATYAHLCHHAGANTIATQLVPNGAGYNTALGEGIDVLFGGGRRHFQPAASSDSVRLDARDLIAEFKAAGYTYAASKDEFDKIDPVSAHKVLALFAPDHMAYDLARQPADEPSLAEMTTKAIDILAAKKKGFFLMVEGGRIDQALHAGKVHNALQDTVALDDAIKAAIQKLNRIDPGLKNTLIVVTADHDHTLVLNGYAQRTGPTTKTRPGVLGLVKNVVTGAADTDVSGYPYTIIGFGNGVNRPAVRGALTQAQLFDQTYVYEATIPIASGGTYSGTDVFIGAIGLGAENFGKAIDNTEVFTKIKQLLGL
jgi:alkaline phosphatase